MWSAEFWTNELEGEVVVISNSPLLWACGVRKSHRKGENSGEGQNKHAPESTEIDLAHPVRSWGVDAERVKVV